jgi:hypothetical protein
MIKRVCQKFIECFTGHKLAIYTTPLDVSILKYFTTDFNVVDFLPSAKIFGGEGTGGYLV